MRIALQIIVLSLSSWIGCASVCTNWLENSGFENGSNSDLQSGNFPNWVVIGATKSINLTNPIEGSQSLTLDTSGGGDGAFVQQELFPPFPPVSANACSVQVCVDFHATGEQQSFQVDVMDFALILLLADAPNSGKVNRIQASGAGVVPNDTTQTLCINDIPVTALQGAVYAYWGVLVSEENTDAMKLTLDNARLEVCECTPGGRGDPHFVTWDGKDFNYHPECDTVLLRDDSWMDGLGLAVHIRTKIVRNWSYIKAAAIRIGGDVLEVAGSKQGGQHYWFNGEYLANFTNLGGFLTTHHVNKKSSFYKIHLGGGKRIDLKTFGDFVRVDFESHTKALYGNSVGILGNYSTGERLARDGVTVIDDVTEYGMQWQVQPEEPMLFHNLEGPQSSAGEKCRLPPPKSEIKTKRRLSEPSVTKEDAEDACRNSPEQKFCIDDVLATQDLEVAGAY